MSVPTRFASRAAALRSGLLTLALCGVLPSIGCGPPGPVAEPSESTEDEQLRAMSAGWLGCQPERVAISEARSVAPDAPGAPTHRTWVATCEDVAMVCSSSGEARCSPLRASSADGSADGAGTSEVDPPRVTRSLPPEVVACTEHPVTVEALFDATGRIIELRPWPGETPEQRNCVTRALEAIDLPEGYGTLVRFEPRDPWEVED